MHYLENETSNIDDDYLLELSRDVRGNMNIPGAHKLDARRRLWRVFTDTLEDEQIHIFVQRPAPRSLSPPSVRSGKRKSIHAAPDNEHISGVAKHRRDFDRFHSENGVRTVLGTIGPVENGTQHLG